MKVLLCIPGNEVEGGISAVVLGMKKGLGKRNDISYETCIYGKRKRGLNVISRLFYEIYQIIIYTNKIGKKEILLAHVQTSFDSKTIIRDSLHLWLAHIFNKKFILHAHGGLWHIIPSWPFIWRKYAESFLTHCDLIIVTSSEEKKLITDQFHDKVRVIKINNSVELPEELEITSKSNASTDKKLVLFASRFIETKGILDLIDAAYKLNNGKYLFQIYGGGPLFETVKEKINTLNIEDYVKLMGEVSLNELLQIYGTGDLYVFPSYHFEGFPMAIFYAIIAGLPIISTKVRPVPDFLNEPDNCLWVEPKNPQMLAEKIELLLSDRDLSDKMRRNNKSLSSIFTVEKFTDEIVTAYKSLA